MNATRTIEVEGQACQVCIGFDRIGQPKEVFLNSGKEGSMIDAMLSDAAVVISIALQHGIGPAALAKSVGRIPEPPISPRDLDKPATRPASPIGAALDLLCEHDRPQE